MVRRSRRLEEKRRCAPPTVDNDTEINIKIADAPTVTPIMQVPTPRPSTLPFPDVGLGKYFNASACSGNEEEGDRVWCSDDDGIVCTVRLPPAKPKPSKRATRKQVVGQPAPKVSAQPAPTSTPTPTPSNGGSAAREAPKARVVAAPVSVMEAEVRTKIQAEQVRIREGRPPAEEEENNDFYGRAIKKEKEMHTSRMHKISLLADDTEAGLRAQEERRHASAMASLQKFRNAAIARQRAADERAASIRGVLPRCAAWKSMTTKSVEELVAERIRREFYDSTFTRWTNEALAQTQARRASMFANDETSSIQSPTRSVATVTTVATTTSAGTTASVGTTTSVGTATHAGRRLTSESEEELVLTPTSTSMSKRMDYTGSYVVGVAAKRARPYSESSEWMHANVRCVRTRHEE